MGSDGSHLAATLHYLAYSASFGDEQPNQADPERVYSRVANRLASLIRDVREVGVDEDPQRELWTLYAVGPDGTRHPARALSDGTLRFLALAVIDLDPAAQGVICLEEPENGIHPARIPAMLTLLKDIAVDVDLPVGPDNPLRQVIINTHSPAVVSEVNDDSLIFAKLIETVRDRQRFSGVQFLGLADTWRTTKGDPPTPTVPRGDVLVYLEGPRPALELESARPTESGDAQANRSRPERSRRVADRDDLQQLLHFGDESQ